jgi:pimeloyl-ACP methyl ester carboxylesterase
MSRYQRAYGLTAILLSAAMPVLHGQTAVSQPRTIDVEGGTMRVWTEGIEQRQTGRPVVILESGAGEGLDTWKPVFAEIARVAPVLAYDRKGLGQSTADTARPTLRRVAQSLRRLLQRLNITPPYILVGHSWGGLLTRAYFDQYGQEVAGLVFLDALNPGLTRAERAKAAPPEDRAQILAPPTLPEIPADTPPGLRAEYEVVGSEMVNDYPEARSLRLPSGVPVVVVVAAPPGRIKNSGGVAPLLRNNQMAELALTSPKGLFIAAGHVGHMVHRDDPSLVARLIEHVLKHAPAPTSLPK